MIIRRGTEDTASWSQSSADRGPFGWGVASSEARRNGQENGARQGIVGPRTRSGVEHSQPVTPGPAAAIPAAAEFSFAGASDNFCQWRGKAVTRNVTSAENSPRTPEHSPARPREGTRRKALVLRDYAGSGNLFQDLSSYWHGLCRRECPQAISTSLFRRKLRRENHHDEPSGLYPD